MSPDGRLLDRDPLAAWIRSGKERIDGYDLAGRSLGAAISQLIESTKGKQRADIAAIQAQTDSASEELKRLRSVEKNLELTIKWN